MIKTFLPSKCCLVRKTKGTQFSLHSIVFRLRGSPQDVTNTFCPIIRDDGFDSNVEDFDLGVVQAVKSTAINMGMIYLVIYRCFMFLERWVIY